MIKKLTIPLEKTEVRDLRVGDSILLTGTLITGRDAAHKWMMDRFILKNTTPSEDDQRAYSALKPILARGLIYHCGPVVGGLDSGNYHFVAAGPTTSIREEPYQHEVIRHFNLSGVIGKGGMGAKTLAACAEQPAVYFHAIGGAASLIAKSVKEVLGVHKLEFGVPEAMWVIQVEDFPAVVTMDAHGQSLHETVKEHSCQQLERLLS